MAVGDDLTTAAATGNTAHVERLLRAGAEVNAVNRFGRSAIQVMMMGSTPVARLLLTHGADPNAADASNGRTPLHDAASAGFLDTVRLLVEHRADPQLRDKANCRAADLARERGHKEVVAFLERKK